ncbi:MAG: porin [candidate division NC10 bacterium]|nr:porin [candidate division NC10 bacterium]
MKKWTGLGLALLLGTALAGAPVPAAAELKVGISGYVKLDIQYGDKLTGELHSPGPSATPLDTDPVRDNSQTIVDARQSRLRATFTDEVAGIKFSGRIETDFYTRDAGDTPGLATSNSARLRLRHAFARADHPSGFFVLAGQFFSSFMNDTIAQPELVDFNGPAGQVFNARQPQLRVGYRTPLAPGMGDLMVEADVEKHFTSNLGTFATPPGDPINEARGEGQTIPLFAGKISWLHPRFQAEVAGAIGESKVILDATGADASETAWGGQVSAQTNVLDPVTVFAHFQVNKGLGRLLNADFADAVVVGSSLENIETIGWYAGAKYQVTPETSINGVFGWHQADEIAAGGFTGASLETHQSIHVNVIHKFWQRWQAGLEYRRFDVEAFNGTDGDVNFVHGALWFFF